MVKKPGVYKITNMVNGKFYIGSSNNLRTRKARHIWELNNGIHNNVNLQSAWDKYGESSFIFEAILICDETEILNEEQKEIDRAWGPDGRGIYNTAKNTLAPMTGITSPMKGRKHSEQTCKQMSESHKGRPSPNKGNKFSEESRKKVSESHKGIQAGEKNSQAILNWDTVNRIREIYATGKYTQTEISKELGISRPTITNIVNNKRWII